MTKRMRQDIGEFHSREGWFFKRLDDEGRVRIRRADVPDEATEHEVVLAANEWASVVAFVSAEGEDGPRWREALRFHGPATKQGEGADG